MHLADNRRASLLVQPPKEGLAGAAVGELALRLELEQQRQKALMLQAGISNVGLMQGTAAGVDSLSGLHVNTQGVECATCGCDLSLAAVISHADPGRAVCPAHYADLDGLRSERQLLLRWVYCRWQYTGGGEGTGGWSCFFYEGFLIERTHVLVDGCCQG